MKGLSRRQRETLEFISDFVAANGYVPSFREMAAHAGIASINAIWHHVNALRRKGYVNWTDGARRTIVLTCRAALGPPIQQPGGILFPIVQVPSRRSIP